MKTGWPSKEQLIQGGTAALKVKDPHFGNPPWQRIVASKKGQWGPADSDGMKILWAAPYAGAMGQVSIEYYWAYGKNYVANSLQQKQGRTSAETIQLLLDRWYVTSCVAMQRRLWMSG
jgi:hypothetical protein